MTVRILRESCVSETAAVRSETDSAVITYTGNVVKKIIWAVLPLLEKENMQEKHPKNPWQAWP